VRKDEALDKLAERGNVAQFVAFRPEDGELVQTFSRVEGRPPNEPFSSVEEAICRLFERSPEAKINIRSYEPSDPRSREFFYGLNSPMEALAIARRLAGERLFVIVNETVNVTDGGVSGVIHGPVIEFAPDDTPRCVEKPGTASLPAQWGLSILRTVYGFAPDQSEAGRLEFSIHPLRRGYKKTHVLAWEFEESPALEVTPRLVWPNRFSRHIGDKAFGLLIAAEIGLPVPRTVVIGRRVAPFEFGEPTGGQETWIRTCPAEPQPGLFTTAKGWLDPFRLMQEEDPGSGAIASVLCQKGVSAKHSGAAIVDASGRLIIEGIAGEGNDFMLGLDRPEFLPESVVQDVQIHYRKAAEKLGPVRFEWVHDGTRLWIVQLHIGGTASSAGVIVPGEAADWEPFPVERGLVALRDFLRDLQPGRGVLLEGEVGLTSHIADLIRKAGRPARLKPL